MSSPTPLPQPEVPDKHMLSALASGAIDGRLSTEQQAQLEVALRYSAEAREFYVRFMGLSAELAYAGRAITPAAAPERRRWVKRNWYPVAVAAAVLVLAMLAVALLMQKPVDVPPAVLSSALNLEWEGSEEPVHSGNTLLPGWLRVKAGLAQVDFIGAVSVWLEGPAALRLDTRKSAYFESGKMVVKVWPGSEGIRVDTPLGSIEDHGTGFGLDVTPLQVTVHVFEGEVLVTPKGGTAKTYAAGDAVVLLAKGLTQPGTMDPREFDYMGYGWTDGFGILDWGPPHHGHWGVAPSGWKGWNPMDLIRDQMGADSGRWAVIEPRLADYLAIQREVRGEGNPWDNDVTWTLSYLESSIWYFGTEEEVARGLAAFRNARQAARDRLDGAEKALQKELTVAEEAQLVALGYMK